MKKRILILLFAIFYSRITSGQEIPVSTEQQLENQTDIDQSETEDDNYLQELEQFRKDPINLNQAESDDLKQLQIVTDLQIANLLIYRKLFGKLISIYELQALPSWDIITIRKILPFVTIESPVSLSGEIVKRLKDGEQAVLVRISQILERAKGFDRSSTGSKYLGGPQRLLFRYRYSYKNLLQYGFLADKDGGEQFFKGAQNKGFDFYSFHFFARKMGNIQSLALGDFTVNLGQGLIQWQSLAFKKSADVMGIKRQAAILKPYHSAGEYYFNRGGGLTIKKGRTEVTAFASVRKLSANFLTDTVRHEDFISSFLNTGYHRTENENADRNNLTQTSYGGNINYRTNHWRFGINGISYNFSLPIKKRDEPYNFYAISGKNWWNCSMDYSYTYKNLHFFGEAAADRNFHKAFIHGLLFSADPRIDISILYRNIDKEYQAVNGNAFTENTYPNNETGFFAGMTIRPVSGWRLEAYADMYRFPWLKYLVDAPSQGRDYLAQLTCTPNKQIEISTRFRNETRQSDQIENNTVSNFLVSVTKKNWRTQWSYKINTSLTLRSRIELVWYGNNDRPHDQRGTGIMKENGFLIFFDIVCKPMFKPYSSVMRLQYFETDGYNSRIYAYENDVLYSFSIPGFYDKGFRYYMNINYDLRKGISFWLRWAQTIFRGKTVIGSGLDEIIGNKRSEIKLQMRWIF